MDCWPHKAANGDDLSEPQSASRGEQKISSPSRPGSRDRLSTVLVFPAMYAITYTLFTGTVLHRAASAKAALDAMDMLQEGGAVVLKITVTRTGKGITLAELQLLARREG